MTSNPLLTKVALSMVILAPILQLGWFKACSTVASFSSLKDLSLKLPPLHVKRILEISSLHLPQLESNQAIDDYIKIIQEKLKIERIKQLEQELSQTYDPRQQAKILQEIIESKDKE